MYRAKIYLGVAALLVALAVGGYLSLTASLSDSVHRDEQGQVERSGKIFSQIARLESLDFAGLAGSFAHEQEFIKAISILDSTAKRSALFEAVEARNARLGKESRKADIIAVTDAQGRVLVRDLDPNVMYQEDLRAKYPAIGIALGGTQNRDIWNFQGRAMRVAAAPIRGSDGRILGALLIGFVMTDKEARHKKKDFGCEVAYLLDGKVVASSFVAEGEGDNAKEDVERARTLSSSIAEPAAAALAAGRPSDTLRVNLKGEDFLAVVEAMPGNSVSKSSGVVLLRSLTQAVRPIASAGTTVLVFAVLSILAALGGAVLTARRFLAPLDQLETGVAEVINGNLDYTFAKPSPDYEGMANALNVMLSRLLGRPEPGEEDDGDQVAQANKRWRTENMFDDVEAVMAEASGGVTDTGTLQLAQEPLELYFKRTFDEYLAAKRKTGEPIDGVTFESFRAKLSQNETALRGKYKCKMVRFKVVVKGSQVTLKPVPIY